MVRQQECERAAGSVRDDHRYGQGTSGISGRDEYGNDPVQGDGMILRNGPDPTLQALDDLMLVRFSQ